MSNPVFVKTEASYITAAMKMLLGAAPGNTYLNQFTAFVAQNGGGTKGLAAYASALANYAGTDNAALAATVVANLGITGTAATTATANVKALFDAKGAARGEAVLQLVEVMVNLQGDATWGTVANNFVNGVNAAYVYSVNTANTSTDLTVLKAAVTTDAAGAVIAQGQTFTLTPGVDLADIAGAFRNGNNPFNFKFTSANETITASNLTLNGGATPDSLIDASTADSDVLNLTLGAGAAAGNAIVANIETVNLLVSAATGGSGVVDLSNFSGVKTINVTGASAGAVDLSNGAVFTALGNTGVTKVDASGVSTAVAVTVDSSTSTATADLTILGGAGGDTLNGGLGHDTISGGAGGDTISGGAGNDTLKGEAGVDTITGGTGADTIYGGAGNDTINLGNDGAVDKVYLEESATANGNDTVNGFDIGTGGDVINASAFLGAAVANYVEVASGVANNVNGSNVVVVTDGTLATAIGSGLVFGANAKVLVAEFIETAGVGTADDASLRFVTTDANGTITSNTQVATLVGVVANDATNSIAAFVAGNFA